MHPSSRNSSSNGYREGQSPRPARPRLSRDAVDRAWENGATRHYADYHPRQNSSTPPYQRQGRPAPAFDRSRQPQNRRPYAPRQETYGTPPSTSQRGGYQQSEDARRFNGTGYRAPGGRPTANDERRPYYPARPQRDYSRQSEDDRFSRFNQGGPGRPARPNYRDENRPRPFERSDRGRDNFARDPRPGGPRSQRDNNNPRWQSRPGAQRDYSAPQYGYPETQRGYSAPRRDYPNPQRNYDAPRYGSPNGQRDYSAPRRDYPNPQRNYDAPRRDYSNPRHEQFEGDYERFDTPEAGEQPEQEYEKHVTRLPDGRVLKGSRPDQRKQARFWAEVEEETGALLSRTPTSPEDSELPVSEDDAPLMLSTPQETPEPKPAKPRTRKQAAKKASSVKTVRTTRATSAEAREGQEKPAPKKTRTRAPQGPATRPSQRGYKWPAAGE